MLTNLPEKMDETQLANLVQKLRDGTITKSEYDGIFMAHTRLIITIVHEQAWKAPYLFDDLLQIAMLSLYETLDKAALRLTDNNITPYLVVHVRGAILDAIRRGKITRKIDRDRRSVKSESYKDTNTSTNEIMEAIEFAIEQDKNLKRREFKKVIIRLRTAGYDNKEIAGILNISISYIQNLLLDIKDYYEQYCK